MDFNQKVRSTRGSQQKYSGRFPEGVQERISNNDEKHGHGLEKRGPQQIRNACFCSARFLIFAPRNYPKIMFSNTPSWTFLDGFMFI